MDRRPDDSGGYRVFPDHAEPCIWMVAGLLSYRLCDRDFDCENCPLDAAIHGAHATAPPRGAVAAEGPPGWGVRDGLTYHPLYGWVSETGEGWIRWGIDGLVARLLDRATEVVFPAAGTSLVQGKVACWVMDDGDLVPLRAPLSGKVVRANPALARDSTLVIRDPYEAGWLMDLDGGPLATRPGLCDAAGRRLSASRRMRRFHRDAAAYLHLDPGVGVTAPDGGEPLPSLRRMLGRERYHRLLFTLLR